MSTGDVPHDAAGDRVGGHGAVAGRRPDVPPDDVHADLRPVPLQLRAHMHSC